MAALAEQRRRDRLLDKRVLQRCVRSLLLALSLVAKSGSLMMLSLRVYA